MTLTIFISAVADIVGLDASLYEMQYGNVLNTELALKEPRECVIRNIASPLTCEDFLAMHYLICGEGTHNLSAARF